MTFSRDNSNFNFDQIFRRLRPQRAHRQPPHQASPTGRRVRSAPRLSAKCSGALAQRRRGNARRPADKHPAASVQLAAAPSQLITGTRAVNRPRLIVSAADPRLMKCRGPISRPDRLPGRDSIGAGIAAGRDNYVVPRAFHLSPSRFFRGKTITRCGGGRFFCAGFEPAGGSGGFLSGFRWGRGALENGLFIFAGESA